MIAEVVRTIVVDGKIATHIVSVYNGRMTTEIWEKDEARLRSWEPENGASFPTSGHASRWLVKFLKKDGWPEPTCWEIWKCEYGDDWAVYLVEEGKTDDEDDAIQREEGRIERGQNDWSSR